MDGITALGTLSTAIFLGTYMFFWPQQILRKLPYTSQTVALAVSAVIEEQGLETQVKWTNDVLIGGKKAAGILCDAFPVEGGSMLLMGIGLNVNMDAEAAHQKFLTTEDAMKIEFTSMAIASRNSFDLEGITSSLSRNLVDRLITLQNGQFAEHLLPEVESRLAFRGETVVFSDGDERLENVIFEGLTSDGFARLRDENGVIQEKMTGRIRPHHSLSW